MSGLFSQAATALADIWRKAPEDAWSGTLAVPGPAPQQFAVNASYFTLRLSEMRLRSARVGLTNYVPVCLVIADYFYDGAYRSLPFVVSQDKLRAQVDKAARSGQDAAIELFDTLVVGPVPVRAPEVGLFVGLFRVQRSDFANLLLDVMGTLGTAAGLTALTAGLPLAKTVYDGVKRVFGINGTDMLVGSRLGFSFAPSTGAPTLTAGPIAYTSLARTGTASPPFKVGDDRRLLTARDSESPDNCDYALLSVEHAPVRATFEDLPFHAQFQALQRRLIETPERDWKSDWLGLMSAIRTSPDLTRGDTSVALASYRAQIEEERALANGEAATVTQDSTAHRSSGSASAVTLLRTANSQAAGIRASSAPKSHAETLATRQKDAAKSLAEIAVKVRNGFTIESLPDPDAVVAALMAKDFKKEA